MKCDDAAALMAAYTDGETDRSRSRVVRQHLDGCPDCAAKHEALLALRTRIRSEIPRHAAPPALRAAVLAQLDSARRIETARQGSRVDRWRWLTGGALAGCAATILAWLVGTAVIDWRVNEDVAVEAVTSHVRATLGNQLIQVASSNQHTVKPWLSSRLDYSPPVPDLQQQGFTLLGGRVDYLDQRPCATLVYKIRDHTIDVFVRPDARRIMPSALRTVRGINVAHASGSGMDWLAVSDVSPDVLTAFVRELADANVR
jgi:anti-sigma factor (TIGR02949 family)